MKVEFGLAFLLAALATATPSYGQAPPPGAATRSYGLAPPGTIAGLFDPSTQTFTPFDATGPGDVTFVYNIVEYIAYMQYDPDFDPDFTIYTGDQSIDGYLRLLGSVPGSDNTSPATGGQFIPEHYVMVNDNFAVSDKNPTTKMEWSYQPSHPGNTWFSYTSTIHGYDKQGNYHSFSYTGQGPLPKNGAKTTIHGSL